MSKQPIPLPARMPDNDDTTEYELSEELPKPPEQSARASYLPEEASAEASESWQRIQAQFVDDPRQSVAQAHQLVSDLVQRIVDAFAKERGELERQWSQGEDVSTEDLRVCLQRYRAFFSRLLPSANRLPR